MCYIGRTEMHNKPDTWGCARTATPKCSLANAHACTEAATCAPCPFPPFDIVANEPSTLCQVERRTVARGAAGVLKKGHPLDAHATICKSAVLLRCAGLHQAIARPVQQAVPKTFFRQQRTRMRPVVGLLYASMVHRHTPSWPHITGSEGAVMRPLTMLFIEREVVHRNKKGYAHL
jgi:hypothetical protein